MRQREEPEVNALDQQYVDENERRFNAVKHTEPPLWPPPTPDRTPLLQIALPQGVQLFGGPCDGEVVAWPAGCEIHVITGWRRGKAMETHVYEYRYTPQKEYIGIYKESRTT